MAAAAKEAHTLRTCGFCRKVTALWSIAFCAALSSIPAAAGGLGAAAAAGGAASGGAAASAMTGLPVDLALLSFWRAGRSLAGSSSRHCCEKWPVSNLACQNVQSWVESEWGRTLSVTSESESATLRCVRLSHERLCETAGFLCV